MRKKDHFEIIEDEIHKFKSRIKTKYGQEVYVIIRNYIHLDLLYDCVLMACEESNPDYHNILKNKEKTRLRVVCSYTHSFYHIADKYGFYKLRIAKFMNKSHATVINGINKASDRIKYEDDKEFLKIYNDVKSKIETYVGPIPENT